MEEKFISIAMRAETLAGISDWTKVYQETIGPNGLIKELTSEEQKAFLRSPQFQIVQLVLADLRRQEPNPDGPVQVITVRLPKCVHEGLVEESFQRRISMNQLCISKLLQCIDQNLVPSNTRLNHSANGSNV